MLCGLIDLSWPLFYGWSSWGQFARFTRFRRLQLLWPCSCPKNFQTILTVNFTVLNVYFICLVYKNISFPTSDCAQTAKLQAESVDLLGVSQLLNITPSQSVWFPKLKTLVVFSKLLISQLLIFKIPTDPSYIFILLTIEILFRFLNLPQFYQAYPSTMVSISTSKNSFLTK